jgi:hypothetical protein
MGPISRLRNVNSIILLTMYGLQDFLEPFPAFNTGFERPKPGDQ